MVRRDELVTTAVCNTPNLSLYQVMSLGFLSSNTIDSISNVISTDKIKGISITINSILEDSDLINTGASINIGSKDANRVANSSNAITIDRDAFGRNTTNTRNLAINALNLITTNRHMNALNTNSTKRDVITLKMNTTNGDANALNANTTNLDSIASSALNTNDTNRNNMHSST